MIREQLVRAALRACPEPQRSELGPELESTALDAGSASTWAFARELADLTRFGLNQRAGRVASAGTRRVVADGLCRGATWLMVLELSTLIAWHLAWAEGVLAAWWWPASLVVVLALALHGFDRLAGAGALIWTVARIPELVGQTPAGAWLPPTLVLAASFGVLVIHPRRRERDIRRLGWLAVPVWLTVSIAVLRNGGNSEFALLELAIVVALVTIAGLAALPTDPRLAIAASVPVTYIGLGVASHGDLIAAVLIAATPVVLALTVLRARQVRSRQTA